MYLNLDKIEARLLLRLISGGTLNSAEQRELIPVVLSIEYDLKKEVEKASCHGY
jgi:hypothetical protein